MLKVSVLRASGDNCIWAISHCDQRCAIVDPGEGEPVLDFLKNNQLELTTILVTHYHCDHIGGIPELKIAYPDVRILGPANEPVPNLTHRLQEGDHIDLLGTSFVVMDLKGHTPGHIGYFGDKRLFCGDVLFSVGCGQVLDGTMSDMYQSLLKVSDLPDDTKIYCAHECTEKNITFALMVDPRNKDLIDHWDKISSVRDELTLPTTLFLEKRINPFLRVKSEEIIKSVQGRTTDTEGLSVFTALREWKSSL